jgi:hypothetical protein
MKPRVLKADRRWDLITMSVLMGAFILFTSVLQTWVQSLDHGRADAVNYQRIADAAPGFYHGLIVPWQATRWVPNWIVGSFSHLLSLSVPNGYRFWQAVLILAIVGVLIETLLALKISTPAALVCLGLVILNAYLFRSYLGSAGAPADYVLILGATIAVRGLLLRSRLWLIGGLLVAVIARQTALPPALVASGVVLVDPAWKQKYGRGRWFIALNTILLPAIAYEIVADLAKSFSGPNQSLSTETLLGAQLHAGFLFQHFARCVDPILSTVALLAACWWLRRERVPRAQNYRAPGQAMYQTPEVVKPVRDNAAAYGALLFGAAIWIQPVLLNPAWASYNEPRLAVFALVPIVVGLAVVMRDLELQYERISNGLCVVLLGLLAIGSLHYEYSVIGEHTRNQTLAVQILVAVGLFLGMVTYLRQRIWKLQVQAAVQTWLLYRPRQRQRQMGVGDDDE